MPTVFANSSFVSATYIFAKCFQNSRRENLFECVHERFIPKKREKKHFSSNTSLEHEVNSFSFALGHRQLWWLHPASLQRWIRCSLNGTAMWCRSKHYSRLLFFTHQRPQKLYALLCQSIPRTTFVCTAAKTYKFSRLKRTPQPQTQNERIFLTLSAKRSRIVSLKTANFICFSFLQTF